VKPSSWRAHLVEVPDYCEELYVAGRHLVGSPVFALVGGF
jgi:hypothetical protein